MGKNQSLMYKKALENDTTNSHMRCQVAAALAAVVVTVVTKKVERKECVSETQKG